MLSEKELEDLIDRTITENKQSVDRLGKNAFGVLMGNVMKQARGKADPELVGRLLREKLK
jgi:aspartyl-tRNA(Asn)/glutamyl-tRNA(Gln) amidotransferase subunit B